MISPPRPLGPAAALRQALSAKSPGSRPTSAPSSRWPKACARQGFSTPRHLRAERRRRPGADRGFWRRDHRRRRRAEPRRATPKPRRCSPTCMRVTLPDGAAGRRRDLLHPGLRHRGHADRGRVGAGLVCAGDRRAARPRPARACSSRSLARGAGAGPRAADDLDAARLSFAESASGCRRAKASKRLGLIDFQDAVFGPPGL